MRWILPIILLVALSLLIYASIRQYTWWQEIKENCAYTRTIPGYFYDCVVPEYDLLNESWNMTETSCWKQPEECYMCDGGEVCR